jgi:hypothetical protein
MLYYDDNYGHYTIESDEDVEFYYQVQRNSVSKVCSCCGKKVRIQPQYDICNSCADKIERGLDF